MREELWGQEEDSRIAGQEMLLTIPTHNWTRPWMIMLVVMNNRMTLWIKLLLIRLNNSMQAWAMVTPANQVQISTSQKPQQWNEDAGSNDKGDDKNIPLQWKHRFWKLCEDAITECELLKALTSMNNDKLLGNDGITKDFHIKFWALCFYSTVFYSKWIKYLSKTSYYKINWEKK